MSLMPTFRRPRKSHLYEFHASLVKKEEEEKEEEEEKKKEKKETNKYIAIHLNFLK